jgi:glycosyltransferase involved in cell wall biosynthesis
MPFLTILTRSFRRPESLVRCVKSVAHQTDPDVEQIVLHDPIGRGVGASYLNLRYSIPRGEYVYLLDDDDYLINDCFVEALKQCAAEHNNPDVIYVSMDVSGTIMPDFSEGLRRGWIACSCFAIKRNVWIEHVMDLRDDYSADFYFIEAINQCSRKHSTAQLDMIASRVGRVSNGQPESITVTT